MVDIYVYLIRRGLKTLEEIPEKLRAECAERLHGEEGDSNSDCDE